MRTLGHLIDQPAAVGPDAPCATALARFMAEPGLVILPVVEDGRPVGAFSRPSFLARMETPGAADRLVSALMDVAPVIAPADARPGDIARRLMERSPAALLEGFIVVDGMGRYAGVANALHLIAGRLGPDPRDSESASLAARVCDAMAEPVAAALSGVERLRGQTLPPAAVAELDAIAEACGEARLLIEAAMQLRRAKRRDLALSPETNRLEELMDEVEARWRRPAERRGLTLMVSYDGEPDCSAEVDRARLMQVFDALIAHALAHARHGVVEASLKARPGEGGIILDCRVRDNGAHHGPAYLETMFEATGPDGQAGGLGVRLGLALAGRIVRAMGGRLTARPNAGAGITKAFEIAVPKASSASGDGFAPNARAERVAHVLVVEDNATNRMVVETLCEMLGCSTESVIDGVEAVEAASAGRFDLILMDIKMPRMDGLTATAEIRKLPGSAGRTPVIALTANADPDDVRHYLAAGMRGVVQKPIKADLFAETLAAALAGDDGSAGEAAAA